MSRKVVWINFFNGSHMQDYQLALVLDTGYD